jgi:hypothetical protein
MKQRGLEMPTDPAVARALARKEVLGREIEFHQREADAHQREVESRETEMREVETFLKQYARFSEESELLDDAVTEEGNLAKSEAGNMAAARNKSRSSGDGAVSQEQFEADARRILIENARPMKRGQLINGFHSRGLRIGGTDEIKNFGAKIWKARNVFVNIPSEGYWPRDIACPVVGYEPSGNPGAGIDHLSGADQHGLFSKTGRAA